METEQDVILSWFNKQMSEAVIECVFMSELFKNLLSNYLKIICDGEQFL